MTKKVYHRRVTQTQSKLPTVVRYLLPRLRDHGFSKVILVIFPEATSVYEAIQLRNDTVEFIPVPAEVAG